MRIVVLLAAFFIYSPAGQAQSGYVVPENPKAQLKESEQRYLQYFQAANGNIRFQSLLTRKVTPYLYLGKSQWLITQTYQNDKGTNTDSSICEKKGLKPLAYFSNISDENYREFVLFKADSIENKVVYTDSSSQHSKPNAGRYNGVALLELIKTMPLAQDKKFTVEAVNPGLRYFEYSVTITVLGRERIQLPGQNGLDCWKLEISGRAGTQTFSWVTVGDQIEVKKIVSLGKGQYFYRLLLV